MAAAKGAAIALLRDAYQRRDRVAMVTFRGDGAELVLRPTGSVEVARARLDEAVTGGRTPLAAGIDLALKVALDASGGPNRPMLALVSDGRATSVDGVDAFDAALEAAARVRRHGVPALVIDAEQGRTRLGLARRIAEAMGAHTVPVEDLTAERLVGAVRTVMPFQ